MIVKNQSGIAFPLALLIMLLVSALAISAATLVSNESRFTLLDESVVSAKYAAEAAAKLGIDMVFEKEQTSANLSNQRLLGTTTYDLSITDNLLTNKSVTIRATAKTANASSRAQARILFASNRIDSPPGLLDLLNSETASFSNGRWPITGNPERGIPLRANPPDGGFHQVLFNDRINEDHFKIDYTATLGQRVNNKDSRTGYGIYYFASGTPHNMTAYVFQYDPGADAFFVKKVIASNPPNSEGPWNNETQYYNKGFAENETTIFNKENHDTDTRNVIRVGLNDLKTYMRLQDGHKNFENLNQPHTITIEVKNGRHYISCDGVIILDFFDEDTANPIPTTNTGTGLRVWNANVDFFNNPDTSKGQEQPFQIIWQNPN